MLTPFMGLVAQGASRASSLLINLCKKYLDNMKKKLLSPESPDKTVLIWRNSFLTRVMKFTAPYAGRQPTIANA